ncbi:hypothetical protein B9G55_08530 [Saccharibacillus sp. O16]|nr:hypothetical protein B9G55_08530 [Saccharibacillus sp. O16]
MAQQLLVYVLVILIGGALSLFLAVYAMLRFRSAPGGRYYILAAFAAAILAFGYAFELTSANLEQIHFWIGIEYFALPVLPVFTLLMCFEYVGISLSLWWKRALYVIPLLTFIFQHTNDFHHLYYTFVGLRDDVPFPIVELGKGPWYLVHTLYLYSCLTASVVTLLLRLRSTRSRFRLQMLAMIAGLLVPVAGNLYYLAGRSPYGIDLGPVFISASFLFHSMAIFRFRMFNVAPIARDLVFENMGDGALVLNEEDRVVDYNRAMRRLVPELGRHSIGQSTAEVFARYPSIAKCVELGGEFDLELKMPESLYVHVRSWPIRNREDRRSGSIVTFVDITERVMLERKLQKLASTDGLTGLYNKNTLIEHAQRELRRLSPESLGVAFVMFDVDHFKKVNDTFGHEAGDLVLAGVADVIRSVLGGEAIAGRYGGDEFVLCLPETSAEEARLRSEQIRRQVEQMNVLVENRRVEVSSSFGIAHARPASSLGVDVPDMQTLMRHADKALYRAKEQGRNCVVVYEDEALSKDGSFEANG